MTELPPENLYEENSALCVKTRGIPQRLCMTQRLGGYGAL